MILPFFSGDRWTAVLWYLRVIEQLFFLQRAKAQAKKARQMIEDKIGSIKNGNHPNRGRNTIQGGHAASQGESCVKNVKSQTFAQRTLNFLFERDGPMALFEYYLK